MKMTPEALESLNVGFARFNEANREAAAALNRQAAQIHDAMNGYVSRIVLRNMARKD